MLSFGRAVRSGWNAAHAPTCRRQRLRPETRVPHLPPIRFGDRPCSGGPRLRGSFKLPSTGTLGRCARPIFPAHSGTVPRLVGPVDLARFDSTVKMPTEGSDRTSRHPGRRVPVRSLCDGPGVHSAGNARFGIVGRAGDYRRLHERRRAGVGGRMAHSRVTRYSDGDHRLQWDRPGAP